MKDLDGHLGRPSMGSMKVMLDIEVVEMGLMHKVVMGRIWIESVIEMIRGLLLSIVDHFPDEKGLSGRVRDSEWMGVLDDGEIELKSPLWYLRL